MLAVGGTADAQDGADAQSAQRLFDQFADPGSEFRTKPFMVWNTEITPHRIDRILSEYKEQGCGGVFIHPRLGLITEYLSPTWNEMVKYTVDKGRDLGLEVWLYDENSYPSGFAGRACAARDAGSVQPGTGPETDGRPIRCPPMFRNIS